MREVITRHSRYSLLANAAYLDQRDSFAALLTWRDAMRRANREGDAGDCPIGSLANELATELEAARTALPRSSETRMAVISARLVRMKAQGRLVPTAETQAISNAVLAAIFLSKAARSSRPLVLAFDIALGHIERHRLWVRQ